MMTSPQVSWLFFKARATSISRLIRKERTTQKNSQPAAARRVALKMGRRLRLLVGYVSIQICALLLPVRLGPPCRRPIFNPTTSPLYVRRYTRSCPKTPTRSILELAVSLPTTEDYRVEKRIVNRNHREWSRSPGRDHRIAPALPRHKH